MLSINNSCTYSTIIKYQGQLIQKQQNKMIQNVEIAQERKKSDNNILLLHKTGI